jgi:hypothetical protein
MATHKPIAVLLVYPSDSAIPARAPGFYNDLFVNDLQSLNQYWMNVSDGAVDLAGTQVFGWRTHQMTELAFKNLDRYGKIKQAIDVFANAPDPAQRVDLSGFDSVAVVGAPADDVGSVDIASFDLQGVSKDLGTSIFNSDTDHRTIAHEMGHGCGCDHSFNDSPTPIDPKDDGRRELTATFTTL